jgi:hypothetical protein
MTKHTVSAIAVIDLANELMERGIIDESYLIELGDDFCLFHAAWKVKEPIQEQRLPEETLIQLWNQANTGTLNSDLGIDIGAKVNIQSKGVLATWLFQCGTLSEAFDVFSKNIALLNPSEYWQKTDYDDQVKLCLTFKDSKYPAIAVDRSIAAMLSWSRVLTEAEITPIRIELSRPLPDDFTEFTTVLGSDLAFNCEEDCIVLSKEAFNQNIQGADPYLKSLVSKQALAINDRIDTDNTLTNSVDKLLCNNLAMYCQISATCDALHVSRSTLFRKLKTEDTNFTKRVKKARILKIKENKGIGDDTLREMLGFQDISSYYRFRKDNG